MSSAVIGTVNLMNRFNDNNVLSTGDDGQIAINTSGGVHILSCSASPLHAHSTLHFEFSKVDSTSETFLPDAEIQSNDRSFYDAVELTFDHTLSVLAKGGYVGKKSVSKKEDPNRSDLDKSRRDDSEDHKGRGPRHSKWSSKNADKKGGCLLAVLWFDHRLTIHSDSDEDGIWSVVADVSELWKANAAYMERPRKSPRNSASRVSDNVQKLRQRCYMQAAVAIAWSPNYKSSASQVRVPSKRAKRDQSTSDSEAHVDSFSVFAVALKSGSIVLWKVTLPAKDNGDFRVIQVLDYGDGIASELSFIPVSETLVYLCQGNLDGTILLHCLMLKNGDVCQLESDEPVELWSEADKMSVTAFNWFSERNILVALKGHLVIVWCLDQVGTGCPVITYQKGLAVSMDFGFNSILATQDELFLSGVEGLLYTTNLDGLVEAKCPQEDSFLPIQLVDLPWSSKDLQINGLATSPNGVFLMIATGPAAYYCHLTVRKPSKIQWLCIRSEEDISAIALSHADSLQDHYDALVYLKWEFSTKRPWNYEIMDFANNQANWTTYNTYQLKLLRYLIQVQILYYDEDADQAGKETLDSRLHEVEELIMCQHVQRSIKHLESKTALTKTEASAKSAMVEFLRKKDLPAGDSSEAKRSSKQNSSHSETCIICKSQISFSNQLKDACPQGHAFSRCCQTLLLCCKVPFRTCSFCKCSAFEKNSSEFSDSTKRYLLTNECTYCDGKLV